MANTNKHIQLKSTEEEEVNFKMRRSFSWDRAFFTSDGFLADEELSSMIQGGGVDVKHELHKIHQLESLEAQLFQEFEASTKKSTGTSIVTDLRINVSPGKKDSQPKKVIGASGPHRDTPIKTPPTKSGSSPGNNVKNLARTSTGSKTGKGNADSPSKTPPVIKTKNKVASVNTSPVSPRSPGSPSSTFAVTQRSNRRSSVTRGLMPKTQSSISLKIKSPPVISHPTSPSRLLESSSCPKSSSCSVDQRSKSRGIKGSPVHQISKPALKNHLICQTPEPNKRQPVKTAANTGLKPNSPKTKKQSSPKAKTSSENIYIISPEILDLKGKINALKMEIDMHKNRCSKMARAERDEGHLKYSFACK